MPALSARRAPRPPRHARRECRSNHHTNYHTRHYNHPADHGVRRGAAPLRSGRAFAPSRSRARKFRAFRLRRSSLFCPPAGDRARRTGKAPTIIATQVGPGMLATGNTAYVRGIGNSKDDNWYVYRKGDPLIDPDTNKTLAYEAVYLGNGAAYASGRAGHGHAHRHGARGRRWRQAGGRRASATGELRAARAEHADQRPRDRHLWRRRRQCRRGGAAAGHQHQPRQGQRR